MGKQLKKTIVSLLIIMMTITPSFAITNEESLSETKKELPGELEEKVPREVSGEVTEEEFAKAVEKINKSIGNGTNTTFIYNNNILKISSEGEEYEIVIDLKTGEFTIEELIEKGITYDEYEKKINGIFAVGMSSLPYMIAKGVNEEVAAEYFATSFFKDYLEVMEKINQEEIYIVLDDNDPNADFTNPKFVKKSEIGERVIEVLDSMKSIPINDKKYGDIYEINQTIEKTSEISRTIKHTIKMNKEADYTKLAEEIKKMNEDSEQIQPPINNNNNNSNNNNSNNSNNNSNNNKDNTITDQKELPKAGLENILIIIAAVLVLGIVGYTKIQKYKEVK